MGKGGLMQMIKRGGLKRIERGGKGEGACWMRWGRRADWLRTTTEPVNGTPVIKSSETPV